MGLPDVERMFEGAEVHLVDGSEWFTGMKVLKHDGSQHHLVGIRPTVPCRARLPGWLAGRDECLEKAVELIRASK